MLGRWSIFWLTYQFMHFIGIKMQVKKNQTFTFKLYLVLHFICQKTAANEFVHQVECNVYQLLQIQELCLSALITDRRLKMFSFFFSFNIIKPQEKVPFGIKPMLKYTQTIKRQKIQRSPLILDHIKNKQYITILKVWFYPPNSNKCGNLNAQSASLTLRNTAKYDEAFQLGAHHFTGRLLLISRGMF